MFCNCESINSLNLSNFDTSKVNNMSSLFSGCSSLTSLDLSNFNTSQAENMNNMFYKCFNLSILNLSNIDTSNVKDMDHMFSNCSLIRSLDLSDFNITKVKNFSKMFYGCLNLEYINLDMSIINLDAITQDIFSLTPNNLAVCFGNEGFNFTNILPETKIFQCNNSYDDNKYICHMKNSSLNNEYIFNLCQKKLLMNCNGENKNNSNVVFYGTEIFYNNYTEFLTIGFNNFNNTDIISYNPELSSRSENYEYSFNYSSKLIVSITIIQTEEKNENTHIIIDNLLQEFDIIEIDNCNNKMTEKQNKTIILTTTLNQKNCEENNISMDLGECEYILKSDYNISYNNSLYILQIISEVEGMKIPKVDYEVYYPLNNSKNLDLFSQK